MVATVVVAATSRPTFCAKKNKIKVIKKEVECQLYELNADHYQHRRQEGKGGGSDK